VCAVCYCGTLLRLYCCVHSIARQSIARDQLPKLFSAVVLEIIYIHLCVKWMSWLDVDKGRSQLQEVKYKKIYKYLGIKWLLEFIHCGCLHITKNSYRFWVSGAERKAISHSSNLYIDWLQLSVWHVGTLRDRSLINIHRPMNTYKWLVWPYLCDVWFSARCQMTLNHLKDSIAHDAGRDHLCRHQDQYDNLFYLCRVGHWLFHLW